MNESAIIHVDYDDNESSLLKICEEDSMSVAMSQTDVPAATNRGLKIEQENGSTEYSSSVELNDNRVELAGNVSSLSDGATPTVSPISNLDSQHASSVEMTEADIQMTVLHSRKSTTSSSRKEIQDKKPKDRYIKPMKPLPLPVEPVSLASVKSNHFLSNIENSNIHFPPPFGVHLNPFLPSLSSPFISQNPFLHPSLPSPVLDNVMNMNTWGLLSAYSRFVKLDYFLQSSVLLFCSASHIRKFVIMSCN